jgi:hypothetical protein
MGEVKNLTADNAVEKIREIAKDANICMFVTDLSNLASCRQTNGNTGSR